MVPIINPPFADTAGAQVCPKISKTIEIHRNPEGLEKGRFTGENPYFLRVRFFRCRLHTVEVIGSNLVSPIPLLSTTWAAERAGKMAVVSRIAPISKAATQLTVSTSSGLCLGLLSSQSFYVLQFRALDECPWAGYPYFVRGRLNF